MITRSVKFKIYFPLFYREEADEYIDIGALNGIFVLGRSMGFIGEFATSSLPQEQQTNLKPGGIQCTPDKDWEEGQGFYNINHFSFRTLPGPEEVEAGSVPSPLGWHFLCPARAHDHVRSWCCLGHTRTEACPGDSHSGTVMYKDDYWDGCWAAWSDCAKWLFYKDRNLL